MKRILLTAVALAALLSAPAVAADLRPAPVYKAPPPAPVYSWTGCYVGGHVGGLWAHKEWFDGEPNSGSFGRSDGTHDPSGFLGGAQGGCDYQFAGGFVIGVAGDYAWTDAHASNASILFSGGWTNHSKLKSLASVTGRVGYAWDRFLGYVKGGGAWVRDDLVETDNLTPGTARLTRSGWTIGVGGEYAFTNVLSGFAEYDYYDFGKRSALFNYTNDSTYHFLIKQTASVFKAGLNLRWGAGPVVARY
jgi:outer membrane immunogenic protein